MTWRAHAAIGANAVWIPLLVGRMEQEPAVLVAIGAFAALLPDLDASDAKIKYLKVGGVRPFWIFAEIAHTLFRHRGVLHSLLAVLTVWILSMIGLGFRYGLDIPIVLTSGYLSHILLDGLNKGGVEYFFPHSQRMRLLPRSMGFRVGGVVDHLLMVLGAGGIVLFAALITS